MAEEVFLYKSLTWKQEGTWESVSNQEGRCPDCFLIPVVLSGLICGVGFSIENVTSW